MMRVLTVMITLTLCLMSVRSEAVLMSDSAKKRPPAKTEVADQRALISEFTQQVLYASVLEQTARVMQRFLQGSNVDLMPNFIQLAIQQVAMQSFNQEQTMEMIRDVYTQCVDIGMDDLEQGMAGSEIQEHIRSTAQREVAALVQNRMYQEIVRVIVEKAWQNQQQMIAQQVMQQRMQQVIAQQQAAMQEAARRQYIQQMQQAMQAQRAQQLQQQSGGFFGR